MDRRRGNQLTLSVRSRSRSQPASAAANVLRTALCPVATAALQYLYRIPRSFSLRSLDMEISARNMLPGKVKSIQPGAVNSEITVELVGGQHVVSIITKASAD